MKRFLTSLSLCTTLAFGGVAAADTLGGFAGSSYVVSPDKVCTPLTVTGGKAAGIPECQKVTTGTLAKMDVKSASAETGVRARFTARQVGKQVVVTRTAGAVEMVRWTSLDPLLRVGSVFASSDGRQVAVEVVVRRTGRESTDIVSFALGKAVDTAGPTTDPASKPVVAPTVTEPPTPDKAMLALLKAARKTSGKKALAAWAKVVAVDADSSEARAALAVAHVKLGQTDEALTLLEALGKSSRSDAIEYLVAARFDKSFKKLLAEPRFRAAVGFDRGATASYERVMGLGGAWEQQGTACDAPTVALTMTRARAFALSVKTACNGEKWTSKFKGTWVANDDGTVKLVLPNKGGDEEVMPCQFIRVGDEDSLRCQVDRDIEFTALPVRR